MSIINEIEIKKVLNVPTFIFDLDGTLADIKERLKVSNLGEKMDWSEFFNPANIKLDKPKQDVIDMARRLHALANCQIVIFSGRADTTREETVKWLKNHKVPFTALVMRPMETEEFTNDAVLKEMFLNSLLENLTFDKIRGVFDDRNQVVKMWRDKD